MNKMLAPQPIREFTIGTVRWPNGYANDAVITETKVMARSFAEARRIVKQQRRSKQ